MFTRAEIGRIFGIPIYLDMFFVLVLLLFTHPYFTRGDMQLMSAGLVIVAGLLLSILLHELGHAMMGRLFGAEVSHIELTGLGGVAHFERSLPRNALVRVLIFLAGPGVNFLLWQGLGALVATEVVAAKPFLALAIAVLASANFFLMAFNLLPAYPLDGGQTLDALLGTVVGPIWAVRIVSSLGLLISIGIAVMAFPSSIWMLLLAFVLFMANMEAFNSVGGFGGGRRR